MPSWVIYVVLAIVAGLMYFSQRKRLAVAVKDSADNSFGSVCARLGLQVREGDPALNLLVFQQPMGEFERTLKAQGQPHGRPTTFTLLDGFKRSGFLVDRRVTMSFGCYLEVDTQLNLPAFELSLRSPNQYLQPRLQFAERPELVAASSGDATLDQQFLIRAADPRLALALAPALRLLSTQAFVHLAGEGQQLWINLARIGLPYFAHAPEAFLLALETAACSLEGRPAPAAHVPSLLAASLQVQR